MAGAPCPDCQLDDDKDWTSPWRKGGGTHREDEKAAQITAEWKKVQSDRQIAQKLGIHEKTVVRWRQKLDLPAHDLGGTANWTEETFALVTAASQQFWQDSENRKTWKERRHPEMGKAGKYAVKGKLSEKEAGK